MIFFTPWTATNDPFFYRTPWKKSPLISFNISINSHILQYQFFNKNKKMLPPLTTINSSRKHTTISIFSSILTLFSFHNHHVSANPTSYGLVKSHQQHPSLTTEHPSRLSLLHTTNNSNLNYGRSKIKWLPNYMKHNLGRNLLKYCRI